MYFKVLQYLCTFTQNSLILFRDSRKKYKKIRKKQEQQQKPGNRTIKPKQKLKNKTKKKHVKNKHACIKQRYIHLLVYRTPPSTKL